MKIIDIAICVDNVDPKGIGRIRCERYNDFVGEKEKAFNYEKWGDTDPFVAQPFLPNNINMIPEVGQTVKILNYNTEKETVNQEYIPGPFTTMFDYASQNFSQQIENTSYGVAVKNREPIRRTTGEYIERSSQFVFAREEDYGIYGKYGSDILFTESGLQLRGGKLLSKQSADTKTQIKMVTTPIFTNKLSKLHLKKFPKKATIVEEIVTTQQFDVVSLNYVIEYEIDSISNPTQIRFFVYKIVKNLNNNFNTNYFDGDTPLVYDNDYNPIKLINEDNSITGATYTINIDNVEDLKILSKNIAIDIRNTIYDFSQKGLNSISQNYSAEDMHPFYFRPTTNFKEYVGTIEESVFKNDILNEVSVKRVGPSNGLIWSSTSATQEPKNYETINTTLQFEENGPEQTFASLISDKIFILSTDANETSKKINFDNLDKYEFSQNNYIKDIEPNTYATVRGENLLRFLEAMFVVLTTHVHPILQPYAKSDYNPHQELVELYNNLKNDILNNSIRIN
jgi:hypothetical protein